MKIEKDNTTSIISDSKQKLLLKSTYSFQLKDRNVKVIFSESSNAQTIENLLVKIATRRIS